MAEVCDNLSSAHGVLMHANLAIHELVKEEEQRLLTEEQKALTEDAKEQQIAPTDEQKVHTEEQKQLTEEHTLPTGEKMEHTKEEKAMVNEQKDLVKKESKEVPNEKNIEHADGHIPLTEEPKSPVDKTPSEEHKVPSDEHKIPSEEQHATTTEEQKTHAEELEALVKEQREEAEEKREGGVLTLSIPEQEMEQATGETGEVDSGEPDAVQEVDDQEDSGEPGVDRPTNHEDNQAKQEVEVTDYHSHLDQRVAVADTTVDPQQEQVGEQNEIVSLQPLERGDSGEKDIPTEREEEGQVAFSEGESKNKDDQVKLMAMVTVLPDEVFEVDEVNRRALSPKGGTTMDLSETNTEDSDSSYPDDLIPSQL